MPTWNNNHLCREAGCSRAANTLGYCRMHYRRHRRRGLTAADVDEKEAFLSYLRYEGDCWLWHNLPSESRGKFRGDYAYRAAYRLFVGPIPGGLDVPHRCDAPACVNPGHLFLGTQADNMADMKAKGRALGNNKGKISTRRITDLSKLNAALQLITLGEADASIAKKVGISKGTVYNLRRGIHWYCNAHSKAPPPTDEVKP